MKQLIYLLFCMFIIFFNAKVFSQNTFSDSNSSFRLLEPFEIQLSDSYVKTFDDEVHNLSLPISNIACFGCDESPSFILDIIGLTKDQKVVYPFITDEGHNSIIQSNSKFEILHDRNSSAKIISFNEPVKSVEFKVEMSTTRSFNIEFDEAFYTEKPIVKRKEKSCSCDHIAFLIDDSESITDYEFSQIKSSIFSSIKGDINISFISLNEKHKFFTSNTNDNNLYNKIESFFYSKKSITTDWSVGFDNAKIVDNFKTIDDLVIIADGFTSTRHQTRKEFFETVRNEIGNYCHSGFLLINNNENAAIENYFESMIQINQVRIISDIEEFDLHENNLTSLGCLSILKTKVQIFPNPSTAKFVIKVLSDSKVDKIEVINSNGQLVDAILDITELNHLNISNHADGLYFVKCYSENNLISVDKIIKIK